MNKHWTITSAFLVLTACGAAEDAASEPFAEAEGGAEESTWVDDGLLAEEALLAEEVADEGAELGTLEQALGEAVCGVAPVNKAVSYQGPTVRFIVPTPYGGACTSAFLTGVSSAIPRNATVNILSQLSVPQAACAQARLRSDYYVNGVRVGPQLSSPGVMVNGVCLLGTAYNYNTQRTVNSFTATRGALAGGTPPSAANARFAAQVVHLGQIQRFSWDITP